MARYSVVRGDPGWGNFINNRNVRVFLDGEEVRHCITADEDQGYVIVCAVDENGEHIIEGDEYRIETLHGRVECR